MSYTSEERNKRAYGVAAMAAMLLTCLVTALVNAIFGMTGVWVLAGYLVLCVVLAFRRLHQLPPAAE